jgi:hypothetical protein
MNKDNNNNRKKKEVAEGLLKIIRASNQEENSKDNYISIIQSPGISVGTTHNNKNLKAFLEKLEEDKTIDRSYKDTDLYRLGFEEGETMGHEIAEQRFKQELQALKTIIEAMIDSK